MQTLLKQMYVNLSESLSDKADFEKRRRNYETQLSCYEKLFSQDFKSEEREKALVCARCFISISRSLAENRHSAPSLEQAKNELVHLEPVFSEKKGSVSKQIRSIAEERINNLSCKTPDEISDSVLFLYLSLMQL